MTIMSPENLCVCNHGPYADSFMDAVDQVLMEKGVDSCFSLIVSIGILCIQVTHRILLCFCVGETLRSKGLPNAKT